MLKAIAKAIGGFALGVFTLIGIPFIVMLFIPDPDLKRRFFQAYLPTWAFVWFGLALVRNVQMLRADAALSPEDRARAVEEIREGQRRVRQAVPFLPGSVSSPSSVSRMSRGVHWWSIILSAIVLLILLPMLVENYMRLFG